MVTIGSCDRTIDVAADASPRDEIRPSIASRRHAFVSLPVRVQSLLPPPHLLGKIAGMDAGSGSISALEKFVCARGAGLSPQLRRVFALLALSCDDDTIGLVLGLSHSTVRHYLDRVLSHVQLRSRDDVPLLYISAMSADLEASLTGLFDEKASQRLVAILGKRTRRGVS